MHLPSLFLQSIVGTFAAWAACPPLHSPLAAQAAVTSYVLDVNIYGEPDRQIAADFAKGEKGATAASIESRYGASGDFTCGSKSYGQGQVVIKNDVIVTSAHNYYENSECPNGSAPPLSDCKFTTKIGGKTTEYNLEREIGSGFKCDNFDSEIAIKDDWIIFKLSTPTDLKIRPYQIPSDVHAIENQTKVVQVAKSKDYNPQKDRFMNLLPRHYGRCRKQFFDQNKGVIESDCDSDGGSSGGAILTPGTNPVLLGVVRGHYDNDCTDSSGSGKIRPYEKGCWASVATPISGELKRQLNALQRPEVESGGPESSRRHNSSPGPDFKDL